MPLLWRTRSSGSVRRRRARALHAGGSEDEAATVDLRRRQRCRMAVMVDLRRRCTWLLGGGDACGSSGLSQQALVAGSVSRSIVLG